MIDIKLIRKERQRVEQLLRRKEPTVNLDRLVALDEKIREIKTQDEALKAKRNELSKKVGELKAAGKDAAALMEEVRHIGEATVHLDVELRKVEAEFEDVLSRLPNLPMEEIKVSHNVADNVILKMVGDKPSFTFAPKHHLELNEKLHLFDFPRAAKTTGAHWPAYRGWGARLEWALINYMIDIQLAHGFTFWMPPLLVRPQMMFGSGQMPKFAGQFYEVKDGDQTLYLVPTSEVVLNALHHDEILSDEELPLRYVAYTPCFRRESGAAGEKERGLIRMHQFNKVEMFCFTRPEESSQMMEQMMSVAEEILQGLGIHYRLSLLVTGDMSFTAAKTIDIEVWLPGQNRYYEVSSVSNCTDYQARRSKIRYKTKGGKSEFVHTLNGSGLATSRLLVALLENNQKQDGSVHLPPALQERLGVESLKP